MNYQQTTNEKDNKVDDTNTLKLATKAEALEAAASASEPMKTLFEAIIEKVWTADKPASKVAKK